MASQTLTDLYKLQPAAQGAIQQSAGYAVFSNLSAGFGAGVKTLEFVFVFETDDALARFVDSGWDASGQADAAAKTSKAGGAYSGATSVAPNVWAYQMTKKGLALQATLQGTKYSKNDDLNNK